MSGTRDQEVCDLDQQSLVFQGYALLNEKMHKRGKGRCEI
jgi:hypothetical protein